MNEIIIQPNQTIYDIAVQYYGTVEAVAEICLNNRQIINDEQALIASGIESVGNNDFYLDMPIAPGTKLLIDTDSRLSKKDVLRTLNNREITTYKQ